MSNQEGFGWDMAKYRVQQERHKPLLGKPFLRYGQCLSLACYFFHLGGILGCRYRDKLDEFGWAFLCWRGEAGAMSRYFGEVAEWILPRVTGCLTTLDYVTVAQSETLHFTGDYLELWLQYGMQKIKPASAMHMCWNYAEQGSAFGAIQPDHFKELWEETHKKRDEKSWQRAASAGLDIPEKQDVLTYDEAEQGEVESFLDYCQRYAPSLYVPLSSV